MPVRLVPVFLIMPPHPHVAALLEQYMEVSGLAEQWVTVREIRSYYGLGETAGPALAGFLQRIHHGSFFSCRYKVARIERIRDTIPPYRIIRRYLVLQRPSPRGGPGSGPATRFRNPGKH